MQSLFSDLFIIVFEPPPVAGELEYNSATISLSYEAT